MRRQKCSPRLTLACRMHVHSASDPLNRRHVWTLSCKDIWEMPLWASLPLQHRKASWKGGGKDVELQATTSTM